MRPSGSGRVRVRRIRPSVSRSRISLNAAAPAGHQRGADHRAPPAAPGRTRRRQGSSPPASSATTRRFSRGLVSSRKSAARADTSGSGTASAMARERAEDRHRLLCRMTRPSKRTTGIIAAQTCLASCRSVGAASPSASASWHLFAGLAGLRRLSGAACRRPPAHRPPPGIFRTTRSWIQCGSHHSTGLTGWPCTWIGEVQVVAARQAGHPAARDLLVLLHHVAGLHLDRREVAVERLHAHAVVDDDAVAVDAEVVGVDDLAVVAGQHRDLLRDGEVEPEVDLPVHFLALVDVGAVVGEARLDRRVAERQERTVPEELRRRLLREFDDLVGVQPAQVVVDLQERRAGSSRPGPTASFSSGECSRISGTTRCRKPSLRSIRPLLNFFGNTL